MRSALRDIQGQMSDFQDEIKTVTGDLVRSVEFCTEEMKDLLTKVNSQSSEVTESPRTVTNNVNNKEADCSY